MSRRTNTQRQARQLAKATGITYQQALHAVTNPASKSPGSESVTAQALHATNLVDAAERLLHTAGIPSEETIPAFTNWRNTVDNTEAFTIPTTVEYPPHPDTHPWDVFPIGVGQHGQTISVDMSTYPHMLLFGHTGAGKTNLQHVLLLKAVGSPLWQITILDPKNVEMPIYRTCRNVTTVATETDDMLTALEHALDDMQKRRDAMQTANLTHFTFLPDTPPAHLIVVDELYALLAPEGGTNTTEESKQRDEAHARCADIIDTIARLGRPAGVHLVLTTQRPDAITLPGSLRANLDCRIALGRMNTAESLRVLDVDAATRTSPHPVGRGVIQRGNTVDRFQTYFVNPRILPSLVEVANHQANMER